MTILVFIVIGLVAGALARLLVPGRDPMGIVTTIVLGIVGSFVGGTLWVLVTTGAFTLTSASWLGSIVGAIIVLLIWRVVQQGRGARAPGNPANLTNPRRGRTRPTIRRTRRSRI